MKGKIILAEAKNGELGGFLVVDRPQGTRSQYCHFQEGNVRCGDWCPLFGEPYHATLYYYEGTPVLSTATSIKICHGKTITFEGFTDERKSENAQPASKEPITT